ncbi:MAG: AlpA family phage regulatory protein [Proteobacteria bacterium]|nr:AlpA family phage regulatory protein [Pseudomonadota bacterium]
MPAPLLATREVVKITTLSKATIHRRINAGSFPKPIELSPGRVAFRSSDIADWLATRDPAA